MEADYIPSFLLQTRHDWITLRSPALSTTAVGYKGDTGIADSASKSWRIRQFQSTTRVTVEELATAHQTLTRFRACLTVKWVDANNRLAQT